MGTNLTGRPARGRRALAAAMAGLALLAATPAPALADAPSARTGTDVTLDYAGGANISVTVPTVLPLFCDNETGDFAEPTNLAIANKGDTCVSVRGVRARMAAGYEAVEEGQNANDATKRGLWLSMAQGTDSSNAFTLAEAAEKDGKGFDHEEWVIDPTDPATGGLTVAAGMTPETAKSVPSGPATRACLIDWEFAQSMRGTARDVRAYWGGHRGDSSAVPTHDDLAEYSLAELQSVSTYLTARLAAKAPEATTQQQIADALAGDPVYERFAGYAARGDEVTGDIKVNGVAVRLVGVLHDDLADGSGRAGLTLMTTGRLAGTYKMNDTATNSKGWEGSGLRKRLATDGDDNIWSRLSPELKAAIRPVTKVTELCYAKNETKKNTANNAALTTDSLWLPSATEVYGGNIDNGGAQYAYFGGGAIARAKALADGSSVWLRSPHSGDGSIFQNVVSNGGMFRSSASDDSGVVLGFSL